MFSPDVPTEDVRLVIDLTLADGTHVDPQTGEAPDFALETANLARNQVLQQAGTSILAQANSSAQQVLSLLQGG